MSVPKKHDPQIQHNPYQIHDEFFVEMDKTLL